MATFHMQAESDMSWVGFRYWNDAMDRAAEQTVKDVTNVGEMTARALAPEGPPRDDYGRRPKLLDDIAAFTTARTGTIQISAVNSMSQETGAVGHEIHGNPYLHFFWERAGRWARFQMVNHPGNAAVGFLAGAFAAMDAAAEQILDANYL